MQMMKQLTLCGKLLHAAMHPESCCTLVFKFGSSTGPLMKLSLLFHCLTYCILHQVSNLRSLPLNLCFIFPKHDNQSLSFQGQMLGWFYKQAISVGDVCIV